MKIKDLKAFLADKPDEAEAFFTLWTAEGPRHYWFNPTGGKKIYDTLDNQKAVQIAYTDDCNAHRFIETENHTMLYYGQHK